MPLIITPTACFSPSVFYDPNHNPLNIPCEGPKVVPVSIPITGKNLSNLSPITIDLSTLFTQGQISCIQSMSYDFSAVWNALIYYYSLIGDIICGGTNQNIEMNVVSRIGEAKYTTSDFFSGGVVSGAFSTPVLNPPKFMLNLSEPNVGGFYPSFNGAIQFSFYNYIVNPFSITRSYMESVPF